MPLRMPSAMRMGPARATPSSASWPSSAARQKRKKFGCAKRSPGWPAAARRTATVPPSSHGPSMAIGICKVTRRFVMRFLKSDGTLYARLATKALETADPALFAYLNELGMRVLEADARCRAAHAASLAEAALTLADAVRQIYAREKRVRGVLDYDDLIVASLDLLKKRRGGGMGSLQDGRRARSHPDRRGPGHQPRAMGDRARADRGIFRRRGRKGTDGTARTVFAVGDEKQSIFSFQGADPVQFEVNRRHFALAASEMVRASRICNWGPRAARRRKCWPSSTPCSPIRTRAQGLTSAEGADRAHRPSREAKGRVEFWPALKPDARPDTDPWRPVDVEPETSPVRRLAARLAERIRGWTDGKTSLPGHDKPIAPGDIMILMPRREPFASEIIRQLKERGIAVAGADRIKLTEQIAVMDLIALGRFVLLPEDELNLAALLRSPMLGLSEDELYALCVDRDGMLWRALERAPGRMCRIRLRACLPQGDARGRRLRAALRVLCHCAGAPRHEAATAGAAGCRSRRRHRRIPVACALLRGAEHAEPGRASCSGSSAATSRSSATWRRGRDEVRVMTVHGAKGLEADIVILPDTTSLPEAPGAKGTLLYTEDGGVVFPMAEAAAPAKVKAAKEAARQAALDGTPAPALCGADPGARAACDLRLREPRAASARAPGTICAKAAAQKLGTPTQMRWTRACSSSARPMSRRRRRPQPRRPCPPCPTGRPPNRRPRSSVHGSSGRRTPRGRRRPGHRSPRSMRAAGRGASGAGCWSMRCWPACPRWRRPSAPPSPASSSHAAACPPSEAEALTAETLAVLDDPEFAPAFAAQCPGRNRHRRRAAGAGRRRPHQWPHRPAGGDRRRGAGGRFQDQPAPARRVRGRRPGSIWRQMALYRAALAKIFPGQTNRLPRWSGPKAPR